jgi:putative transposase
MGYKTNNNIVYSCKFHIVWCVKYRRKILSGEIEERFKQIAAQVCQEMGVDVVEMETMPDHVHLLLEIDPQLGAHRVVKAIKGRSSRLLRAEFSSVKSRLPSLWTNSYFVATVGGAPLEIVKQYIEQQKSV